MAAGRSQANGRDIAKPGAQRRRALSGSQPHGAEEDALREAVRRYEAWIQVAPDWIWETDAELRFTYFSPNFEARSGTPPERALGKRPDEIARYALEPERLSEHLATVAARQPFQNFIYRDQPRDSRPRWIRLSGRPAFGSDGVFLGYRGTGRDVTAEVELQNSAKTSERRLQALHDASTDWVWELDETLRFSYVSASMEVLTGLPAARLLGKHSAEIQEVWAEPAARAEHLSSLRARRPFRDVVLAIGRPDGSRGWFQISGRPVYDEAGLFRGYLGTGTRVTEVVEARERAQAALRESEERFKQLFEAASDWFWEMDADLRISYISPDHGNILGLPQEAKLGKRREECGDQSVNPEQWRAHLATLEAHRPFRDFIYRQVLPGPNGRAVWIRTSGIPVFGSDGAFQGYRGAASDVTAQVEAEARIREAQQRFRDAMEHIGKALSIYDAKQRLIACNQAYRDLHKGANGQLEIREGMSMRDVMDWRVRTGFWRTLPFAVADLVDRATDRLERSSGTWEHELADGRSMLVDYRRLPDGGSVSLWTDVTSVRQAEARRRELEMQLYHSQKLEALGVLAGGIAHDLNNALTPVLAMTTLVWTRLPAGSREREDLALVLEGGKRAKELVQQILAFSRKETTTMRLLDPESVISDGLKMLRATISSTISLVAAVEPVPQIRGDPGQLHQVLANLVTNAAQAIGEKLGTITVALRHEGAGSPVRLSVADTGCGIDGPTKDRIFEPFFTTKAVGQGTGLGLSVAYGIVSNHGGTITVDSTLGRGTRFDILLPVAAAELDPSP